jgi:hypothetical protein
MGGELTIATSARSTIGDWHPICPLSPAIKPSLDGLDFMGVGGQFE